MDCKVKLGFGIPPTVATTTASKYTLVFWFIRLVQEKICTSAREYI